MAKRLVKVQKIKEVEESSKEGRTGKRKGHDESLHDTFARQAYQTFHRTEIVL